MSSISVLPTIKGFELCSVRLLKNQHSTIENRRCVGVASLLGLAYNQYAFPRKLPSSRRRGRSGYGQTTLPSLLVILDFVTDRSGRVLLQPPTTNEPQVPPAAKTEDTGQSPQSPQPHPRQQYRHSKHPGDRGHKSAGRQDPAASGQRQASCVTYYQQVSRCHRTVIGAVPSTRR